MAQHSMAESAAKYTIGGFGLVWFSERTKAPKEKGWNKPESVITQAAPAMERWRNGGNIGCVHSVSGTATLDIDNPLATRALAALGIDLDAMLAVGKQSSGGQGRKKAWYKVPAGIQLGTHKLTFKLEDGKPVTILELRSGAGQDVLPPSIHPSGTQYTWIGEPVTRVDELPELPSELLAAWQDWREAEAIMQTANPFYVEPEPLAPTTKPTGTTKQGESVIDTFNTLHDIPTLLTQHGYKQKGNRRFVSPDSTSGMPGVIMLDSNRCVSYHGCKLYADGKSHDAFSVYCALEHNSNQKEAVKAAAKLLGLNHKTKNIVGTQKAVGTVGTVGTASNGAGFDVPTQKQAVGTVGTADADADADTDAVVTCRDEPLRPSYRCYESAEPYGRAGLYFHGNNKDGAAVDVWIASPITATAVTGNVGGGDVGLLVRWRNVYNTHWQQWAVPASMLAGDGVGLRSELLSNGVLIDTTNRNKLADWMMHSLGTVKQRAMAATTTGWHCNNRVFVLPDSVVGEADMPVHYQSESAALDVYAKKGSMAEWQRLVAEPAAGNPILITAICAALAAPLQALLQRSGAGIHLVGDSSTGKTTALRLAASVFGGEDYVRTWRATANGLEGVAAALNDGLLVLDEISECEPRDVGAIIYSIGNGTGKSRATRHGTARRIQRWRCVLLSSGERTLEATLAEINRKPKSGQQVRLLNIPVQGKHGCFDELHGAADGRAFSDALRSAALQHCGHAGREFIQCLADMQQATISDCFSEYLKMDYFSADDALAGRAASVFAMLAMAGELAIAHGVVPWEPQAAEQAAAECYRRWQQQRGDSRNETDEILDLVRSFVQRHGDSRFSSSTDEAVMIRDRAGFFEYTANGDERIYLFTADGLREATKGYDLSRVGAALRDAGWIYASDAGRIAKQRRIHNLHKAWYYHIQVRD